MTVGIGLLCEGGKYILLGSDTRASYGTASRNDEAGKLFDLPHGFYVAISGEISYCEMVVSELYERMSKLGQEQQSVEFVRNEIVRSQLHIWRPICDAKLIESHGLTLDQYHHDASLVDDVRRRAEQVIADLKLPVQLIIAGFHRGTPILLVSDQCGSVCEEVSPGIAVIGSGGFLALHWLNYRGQNLRLSLQRSFFHLCEAKQFAEFDLYVGPTTNYLALSHEGRVFKLEGQDALLQNWWNRFGARPTDDLDKEEDRKRFMDAFEIFDSG
jgi:hypothetical protein